MEGDFSPGPQKLVALGSTWGSCFLKLRVTLHCPLWWQTLWLELDTDHQPAEGERIMRQSSGETESLGVLVSPPPARHIHGSGPAGRGGGDSGGWRSGVFHSQARPFDF